MKVTCDRCHKEFEIQRIEEQTKTINGVEVVKTYFSCPCCGTKYTICYDTTSTFALKKQIKKKIAQLGDIRDPKQYQRKLTNIKKSQNRLQKEQKIIQSKYCGEFE